MTTYEGMRKHLDSRWDLTKVEHILKQMDEILRIYDGRFDEEGFEQVCLNFFKDVAEANLDHDTYESHKKGTFPKRPGKAGSSHVVWEVLDPKPFGSLNGVERKDAAQHPEPVGQEPDEFPLGSKQQD